SKTVILDGIPKPHSQNLPNDPEQQFEQLLSLHENHKLDNELHRVLSHQSQQDSQQNIFHKVSFQKVSDNPLQDHPYIQATTQDSKSHIDFRDAHDEPKAFHFH